MRRSQPNRMMDEFAIQEQVIGKCARNQQGMDSVNDEALQLGRFAEAEGESRLTTNRAKEDLAHNLGYPTARQMMEQTEIVLLPSGTYMHLTTDSDGYWVAWSDKPFFDIQRFESRQAALVALREMADAVFLQS